MRRMKPILALTVIASLMIGTVCSGQYVLTRSVPPLPPVSPAYPYSADYDWYSGAAAVQMALNGCASSSARTLIPQTTIYNEIQSYNSEGGALGWYCDPSGVEGALEADVYYSSCGCWSDVSDANRQSVLESTLYWIDTLKYPAVVSIGAYEHWVAVTGFKVTSTASDIWSGTITLDQICYHDPLASNPSTCIVSGATWLSDVTLWGTSHSRPGSAWDNEYIAIVEPPEIEPLEIVVEPHPQQGELIPQEQIAEQFTEWFYMLPKAETCGSDFPLVDIAEEVRWNDPILVEIPSTDARYYWISAMEPSQLVAIVNPFDSTVEEFRVFEREQNYVVDGGQIAEHMVDTLRESGARVLNVEQPRLVFSDEFAGLGRCQPVWQAHADIVTVEGVSDRVLVNITTGGLSAVPGPLDQGIQGSCVTFESFMAGQEFKPGGLLAESGIEMIVSDSMWGAGGYLEIYDGQHAGGSGHDGFVQNVALGFSAASALSKITLDYGVYGGQLALVLNDVMVECESFRELDGQTVGGILIAVRADSETYGHLELTGIFRSFYFGRRESEVQFVICGQELWIDNICFH